MFRLPLHFWARECFEVVGERCNGLIQVDERTEKTLDLRFVRVRVTNKHLSLLLQSLMVVVNKEEYRPSAAVVGRRQLPTRMETGDGTDNCGFPCGSGEEVRTTTNLI